VVLLNGEFKRAARLLDLFADHLRKAVIAEVRGEKVAVLEQQIAAFKRREEDGANGAHDIFGSALDFRHREGCENHQERIVYQILKRIHEQYDETLSLQDFAEELQMNRAHLSALFSRLVGLPFRSYVKTLRLCEAEKLLRNPITRISEVAHRVGYADPNRFRLDFKSRTGLPPTAWRELFG
jgi:AraC-like DNA-binding protein